LSPNGRAHRHRDGIALLRSAPVSHRRLPTFISDLFVERRAIDALIAGSLALFAAGLDPRVWSASQPSVQAAIRARPELEAVILLGSVAGAVALLAGGAIGDTIRASPVVLGGLAVAAICNALSLVLPDGLLLVGTRVVSAIATSIVIPVAVASVATAYRGVTRATAIGLAYAAYGAAMAIAPPLLFIVPGVRWPAFAVAIAATLLAIAVGRSRIPDLPRPLALERPYVVSTALWGSGVVIILTGLVWFSAPLLDPVRLGLMGAGALALVASAAWEARRRRLQRHVLSVRFERRAVAVAVFVGIVLGAAQTVPLLQAPLYFQLVLRYGPLLAVAAVGPLFAALIVAGPIAGYLLTRFTPRTLVGVGVLAVGVGNLVVAVLATPGASYLGFVVPFVLVGAGFVVATTVRTAIIFASMPRGLPATAAALNEASITVGTRLGIVAVTAIVAQVALLTYAASLAGQPQDQIDTAVAAFRDLLTAIGTPSFSALASAIQAQDVSAYVDAYTTGIRAALLGGGVVAVVAGIAAWIILGRRDPLVTVWDLRDERSPSPGP
jgi:MFS family permease